MERVVDDADQGRRDADDVIFTSSSTSSSSAAAKFLLELKVIASLAWPTVRYSAYLLKHSFVAHFQFNLQY